MGARKEGTEIVVHAYDCRDWSGDRSNANRSFENRSAATGGSDLGDGCSREIDYYCRYAVSAFLVTG